MAIATSCPNCKANFRLDDSLAGKKARCQRCSQIFVVPVVGASSVLAAIPVPTPPPPSQPAALPPQPTAFQTTPPAPALRPPVQLSRPEKTDPGTDFADLDKPPGSTNGPIVRAPSKEKVSPVLQGVGIAAGIGGAALGRFVGLPMLIVLFFAAVVGVPLHFLTSGKRRNMVPAGAVQAGHASWMLLAVVLIAAGVVPGFGFEPLIFLEAVLFLAAAIAVVLWPHWIPIVVLTVYQAATFLLNFFTLTLDNPPPDAAKALILHLCLRVLAIGMMWEAFFRKSDQPAAASAPPTEDLTSLENDDLLRQARKPARGMSAGLIVALSIGGLLLVFGVAIVVLFLVRPNPNQAGQQKKPPPGAFQDNFKDPAFEANLRLTEKNAAAGEELGPNPHTKGPLAPQSFFWRRLGKAIQTQAWQKTTFVNGTMGQAEVQDVAPENGGLLIGLRYTCSPYINSLQPIYLTADGEKDGTVWGNPQGLLVQTLKAEPGYAVGAMNVRSGQLLNTVSLIFMKVTDQGLDRRDAYRSQTIGSDGGGPYTIGGDGSFFLGLSARTLTQDFFVRSGAPTTLSGLLSRPK